MMLKMKKLRLLVQSLLLVLTVSVIPEHLVTLLPGASSPLSSNWYSGNIRAGTKPGTKIDLHYHYTLILSHSDKPFDDPLLLWTNGGNRLQDHGTRRNLTQDLVNASIRCLHLFINSIKVLLLCGVYSQS